MPNALYATRDPKARLLQQIYEKPMAEFQMPEFMSSIMITSWIFWPREKMREGFLSRFAPSSH